MFAAPAGVAARLVESKAVFGLTDIEVRFTSDTVVCLWLTLDPWLEPAAAGYPVEQVAVTVPRPVTSPQCPVPPGTGHGSTGTSQRTRPGGDGHGGRGSLPPPGRSRRRRWSTPTRRATHSCSAASACGSPMTALAAVDLGGWTVAYITIVHRHLQAEEYWRRTGRWPAEDAPHGEGHHPIQTPEMQTAASAGGA